MSRASEDDVAQMQARIEDLQRENDLLTAEVLRLRIAGSSRREARAGSVSAYPNQPSGSPTDTTVAPVEAVGRLEAERDQAVRDARWLAAHLRAWPRGAAARRTDEFRRLMERYRDT